MTTPNLFPSVPGPRTWAAGMPIKAPYLRSDAAQAVALLGTPPLFIGQQAQNNQSIPNSSDTAVTIDTEIYDNAFGHLDTTLPTNYYDQLNGWYLCEGTAALDYTGGNGAITAGISLTPFGGSATTWYGQRIPNSGTGGQRAQPAVSKLIKMTTAGRPNADFVQLILNQNSGGAQNTMLGTNRVPWLQARWVAATTGPVGLTVPVNMAWPVGTNLTAQASSGATSLAVADPTGLLPGGTLGLDVGTAIAETVTIGAGYTIGSNTVPVTVALVNTHLNGAAVAVPVSAAFMNKNVRDAVNFLIYPPICEAYYNAGTATLAAQTFLPTTGTAVPLDTIRVDNYGGFNTGTGVYTVPAGCAGTYYAYTQCHQSMNGSSQALAAGLTIHSANYNGGATFTWWGGCQAAFSGANAGNCAVARRKLRLNVGDTVSAAAFQSDSGTATTTLDHVGGSSVSESRLILVWQGA